MNTLTETTEFDAYDASILAALQKDARITMAQLGRLVHLSQPAVTERVRKPALSGVITGYRAQGKHSGGQHQAVNCKGIAPLLVFSKARRG